MSGQAERMLELIHHRIIEAAKKRHREGDCHRPFAAVLRAVAIEQPEVKNGSVMVEVRGKPGNGWKLTLDWPEPDPRAP